jgi:hypothetical protein
MESDLILSLFNDLEGKRRQKKKLHNLDSILSIGITTVICSAQTWKQMEEFVLE